MSGAKREKHQKSGSSELASRRDLAILKEELLDEVGRKIAGEVTPRINRIEFLERQVQGIRKNRNSSTPALNGEEEVEKGRKPRETLGIIAGILFSLVAGAWGFFEFAWPMMTTSFWLGVDQHVKESTHVKGFVQEQQRLAITVEKLRTQLTILTLEQAPIIRQKVMDAVKLQPLQLQKEAPRIAQLVTVAADAGIEIDDEAVHEMVQRLYQQSPQQATLLMAAHLNSRTAKELRASGEYDRITSLTNACMEQQESVVSSLPVPGKKFIRQAREFHDCVQVLDGTEWNGVMFTKCLLIYRGGPIKVGSLFFRGSLIKIEIPESPSESFQNLTRTLFANADKGPNPQP